MDVMASALYPEGSITRRVNRENVLLLGGGRALLMQLAHPKVAAGVDEHSDFRSHPVQRLRRTVLMTMAIVFGDRETALSAARAVNQTHGKVRGHEDRALAAGLLPAALREQYGLRWGAAQRRLYRLMVIALPRMVAVTPPVLRVWPLPGHNVKLTPSLSLTPDG